jgi:hypothetical protein
MEETILVVLLGMGFAVRPVVMCVAAAWACVAAAARLLAGVRFSFICSFGKKL